jgi:diguanylate cyclase (GGDEF)-like protein
VEPESNHHDPRGIEEYRAYRSYSPPWGKRSRKPATRGFSGVADETRYELSRRLVRLGVLFGFFLLVPSIWISFSRGDAALAVLSGAAFLAAVALLFLPSIDPGFGDAVIVAILFFAGAWHQAGVGALGSGPAWLCASAAVATVFFGLRGGAAVIAAEAALMACLGATARYPLEGPLAGGVLGYLLSSLETIVLSALVSFGQAFVLGGLHRSNEARGRLASELSARYARLAAEAAGRVDAERRAVFLESHDRLTQLPDRVSFELSLARSIEAAAGRGRILGVMSIGIDRLRRVCEAHGHGAGDAVLVEAASRLSRAFRDDDLVGRSAGDVFLVMLSDIKSPEDAREIVEKVRKAFDRSFPVEGTEIGVTASCGIALYPGDGLGVEALVRASDVALHAAKEDGPGSYRLYDAELHRRIIELRAIEGELLAALRAEAFVPWFQPKVDARGRIVGAEALARWSLPEGGLRLPSEFIGVAERSGVISALGRIVLAKACASAAAWEAEGLDPIPVSVNLSPYQFRSEDIVRDVRAILSATGLAPSRLDLEITESGIMEDGADAVERLAQLKALGCTISIDDFGTGYSSFATLRDFPVDCVKLPQAFVSPLPDDPRAGTIAASVIELAHRLHFSVVAEGVESEEQFAWLGAARCDLYQGFLFAAPMPEREFRDALARGTVDAAL